MGCVMLLFRHSLVLIENLSDLVKVWTYFGLLGGIAL